MTELQVTINNLKEVCITAGLVLEKLEKAQKDLENPPQHIWKHGDVFVNINEEVMICYNDVTRGAGNGLLRAICIVCESGLVGCCTHRMEAFLPGAKFLFNIKDKL